MLIVGLVMLLLLTLAAVASVRMATTHVQISANEQFRVEATTAANYALDMAISSPDFVQPEHLPALDVVSLQQVAHGSGTPALPVKYVPPKCHRYRYLKNAELTQVTGEQSHCVRTAVAGSGANVFNADGTALVDDNSLCVTTLWEVGAEVSDPQTGANVTVTQGVEMQMELSEAENLCAS